MNVRRFTLVLIGCACVVAVLLVQARSQKLAAVRSSEVGEETKVRIESERERSRQLVEQLEAAEADVRALQAALPPPSAERAAASGSFDPFIVEAELSQVPEYQLAQSRLQHAELRLKYGHLYAELGLTAQEVERFETARAKMHQETTDLWAAAKEKGLSPDDPSLRPLNEKIGREFGEVLQEVLGEERIRRLRDYDRTLAARQLVVRVAGAAAMSGQPLNPTQADALVKALVAAAPSDKRPVNLSKIDWARADAQAGLVLSPTAFTIYRSTLDARQSQQFNDAMRRALAEEKSSAAMR